MPGGVLCLSFPPPYIDCLSDRLSSSSLSLSVPAPQTSDHNDLRQK